MTKTLSMSDVKAHLPRLVNGVRQRAEEVVVTRNGKPAAVLINYEEYESMRETLDILSRPRLRRQIMKSARYFARGGRGTSIEEALGG